MDLKMKFEKEKEKKQKRARLYLAQAAQPDSPPAHRSPPSPFLFRSGADKRTPPVRPFPPPSFLLLPCPAGRRRTPLNPPGSRPFPFLSFLPEPAN
jgi:hypothetical protein